MRLSKTSTQAILAVTYLATTQDDAPVQAKHIAQFLQVPIDSVLKILQSLAREQVIASRLGRGGGYYLDRDGNEISLLEIIEAIDGPMECESAIRKPALEHKPLLDRIHQQCNQATNAVRKTLQATSIGDLSLQIPSNTNSDILHRLSSTAASPLSNAV